MSGELGIFSIKKGAFDAVLMPDLRPPFVKMLTYYGANKKTRSAT
jgi:hypothetical protein